MRITDVFMDLLFYGCTLLQMYFYAGVFLCGRRVASTAQLRPCFSAALQAVVL